MSRRLVKPSRCERSPRGALAREIPRQRDRLRARKSASAPPTKFALKLLKRRANWPRTDERRDECGESQMAEFLSAPEW